MWNFRYHWKTLKPKIQQALRSGHYRFSVLQERVIDGEIIKSWSAADALVLKAMTFVLTPHLIPHLSKRCFHLAGHGGIKGALNEVKAALPEYQHVMRTDVKGYYAHIDHHILYEQCCDLIEDKKVRRLICQYLKHVTTLGGNFWDNLIGIPRGCALSPLMGAIYLKPLDNALEKQDIFYLRSASNAICT